ncbi:MAG: SAM-dependent methyltransferase [Bauldia sp.]|nr:SAM-dependent methyltransferase [Bauldia sp.]
MTGKASASSELSDVRPGEVVVDLPSEADAHIYFIGRIATPWTRRADCPRKGDPDNGPPCRVAIDPRWADALAGLEGTERVQVLYWMDRARRDLVLQSPAHDGTTRGTFALRSPNRPNPIASSIVRLIAIEGTTLVVRGLDCLDGTPVVDVKPEHCVGAEPQ